MIVRHKGATSNSQEMPGGGPQGTNLGILIYLVNVNSCGVSLEEIDKSLQEMCTQEEKLHPILPTPPPNPPQLALHVFTPLVVPSISNTLYSL